jgi:hypothetical protein
MALSPPAQKFRELAGRKLRPQKQLTQALFLPPAQGGINAVDGAANVPPNDALILYNLVPGEYGASVRKGYKQHCVAIPDGDGIKTLIPFEDTSSDTPVRKLFACTSNGIYDVTTPGATPSLEYEFTLKDARAGWCSWTHFVNIANAQFLLVCDNSNGYLIYTAATETWAAGVITGPAPELNFDFVTIWKNRVWFVQGGSGTAWYLPVNEIGGTAKPFYFGSKFRYGGYLKSLWNWTLDGGEGVDDYLVALSSAGDMVVYKGTDPDTTGEFVLHGSWFVGRPTQGRRNGDDMGGELLVLTQYGLLQCSKLIAGLPATDEGTSISHKINTRINNVLNRGNTVYGWQIKFDPANQIIFVVTPKEAGIPYMQFVYSLTTGAWTQFYGLPMKCAEVQNNKLYFGGDDNIVYTYEGYVDHVMLADDGASATAIDWEMLQSYQSYGAPATYKRVQFLRPQFIGQAVPAYTVAARYDFDLSQLATAGVVPPANGALWNTGLWDTDQWGGGYIVSQPPYGGSGMGRHVAIAMRGRSSAETIHVGTDVMFDTGGML